MIVSQFIDREMQSTVTISVRGHSILLLSYTSSLSSQNKIIIQTKQNVVNLLDN